MKSHIRVIVDGVCDHLLVVTRRRVLVGVSSGSGYSLPRVARVATISTAKIDQLKEFDKGYGEGIAVWPAGAG